MLELGVIILMRFVCESVSCQHPTGSDQLMKIRRVLPSIKHMIDPTCRRAMVNQFNAYGIKVTVLFKALMGK